MAVTFTDADKDQLVRVFESLDVKPKMDDAESLRQWMSSYLASQGRMRLPSDDSEEKQKPQVVSKTTVLQTPRIVTFSGNKDAKEVSFESWYYEVKTLLREGTFSQREIETATKKSLRGPAADVVRRMGIDANLEDILWKFSCRYGVVERPDTLLTQFYGTEQQADESVAGWACRLEEILDRAAKQEMLIGKSINMMLKSRFWDGLRQPLKSDSREKAERIQDFDELLVAVRKMEAESGTSNAQDKPAQVKSINSNKSKTDDVDNELCLKALLQKMSDRMDGFETTMKSLATSNTQPQVLSERCAASRSQDHDRGYGRGQGQRRNNRGRAGYGNQSRVSNYNSRLQHQNDDRHPPPQPQYGMSEPTNNDRWFNYSSNSWQNRNPSMQDGNQFTDSTQLQNCQKPAVICYRCKLPGHVAYGCRADLGHLNLTESV